MIMNTLTAKQAEVLKGLVATGGVALHLQTGRTQAVIRKLIQKGAATIALDGRVVAVEGSGGPRHFTSADILAAAQPLPDSEWKKAEVTLKFGDTIDSPYSTKWYFTGSGRYTFLIHPTSLELRDAPESARRTYTKAA
jgi:hypothetical protein